MAVDAMAYASNGHFAPRPRRQPIVPPAVMGMLIFVAMEVIFFTALLSAFTVIKAGSMVWSPPGDITLPVRATAFNTLVLVASGVLLYLAGRALRAGRTPSAKALTHWAVGLGAFFVAFQGWEWVRLIQYGMTMTSGIFGACFFLIIGTHAVHALAAIVAMLAYTVPFRSERLRPAAFQAMQIFWFFVVGIWPVLYGLVYLS